MHTEKLEEERGESQAGRVDLPYPLGLTQTASGFLFSSPRELVCVFQGKLKDQASLHEGACIHNLLGSV